MDDVGVKVRSLRTQATTPYLPCSVWVVSLSTTSPFHLCVGKLLHYSRVCGSCSTVPVPLHNVAGAPVSTASPSEFVPV